MNKKFDFNLWNPFARLRERKKSTFTTLSTRGGGVEDSRIKKTPPSTRKRKGSYLPDETKKMARSQRQLEQQGHRKFARVNARDHTDESLHQTAPEGEPQNDIKQHPWLDTPRFDGIDPNNNPVPALNTTARMEYDNAVREQQLELQMRLGLAPKMGTAPKPQMP